MAAVQRNGYAILYVKEQTPELCMAAVQRNGYAILYVKEQTPEICMAAVQQNGDALQYVKEPVTFLTIAKQLNIEVDMDNDVLVAAQLAIAVSK